VILDVLLRRMGNLEEAECLCQEALVRTLVLHESGTVERFGPYAMRTALNLATDRARRARFQREIDDLESAVQTPPTLGSPDHARLRAEVARLPEGLRDVIALRYDYEMSFAEIASRLGLSKNAVFARHGRALDKLRAVLARRRS
jgi:RNA polymerase sigma-70 factor (ECF subfamily)